MEFKDKLNEYIELLSCSAKELAEEAKLSPATLSRYRRGERLPEKNQLSALIDGIAAIAEKKNIPIPKPSKLKAELEALCAPHSADCEVLRRNLNTLLLLFPLSVSELARELNYDPSHISRIRGGERQPADPLAFAADTARFVTRRYADASDKAIAAKMMNCGVQDIAAPADYFCRMSEWLTGGAGETKDYVSDFLKRLDDFNLNEYIRAIHFDELKVPSVPFQLPGSKSATGLRGMMDIELDFLKAAVLSKSTQNVIMYSDMPMNDMAKDKDFPKKWMFGMAMLLKKGLHLEQIHNIDRSFPEMMLGLESWIPMYMTGQVSPYYLKGTQNGVFMHLLKVSGTAALSGEAIAGSHAQGRYYLTKSKDEVSYYRKRASALLSKALPLMDIYREDRKNELKAFLLADAKTAGRRRSVLSAPPLYTMKEDFLERFLHNRGVSEKDTERIMSYAAAQKQLICDILSENELHDEIAAVPDAEFQRHPPVLSLAGIFYENDLAYSPEEYAEHLSQTELFAKEHPGYSVSLTDAAFRKIKIVMHEGEWAMVSKDSAPAIHFVIRHPKLRCAIENMIIPVKETE